MYPIKEFEKRFHDLLDEIDDLRIEVESGKLDELAAEKEKELMSV